MTITKEKRKWIYEENMGRVRGKEERGRANYDFLISESYKSSKLNANLFKFTKLKTKS